MDTLFLSDLHLDTPRPEKIGLFLELLEAAPGRAGSLYILGDLFETWAGDDDLAAPHDRITAALADAAARGLTVLFMRGNRDLLVGTDFARRTGCRLLPDPSVIELDGTRILITHGDCLCTDDRAYQVYRRLIGLPPLQRAFLTLPLALRRRFVRGLRRGMHRPGRIVDAVPRAIEDALRTHRTYTLIHGHTHLEGCHRFHLDGRPAVRYVLGDWYRRDSILEWRGGRPRIRRVRDWLAGRDRRRD